MTALVLTVFYSVKAIGKGGQGLVLVEWHTVESIVVQQSGCFTVLQHLLNVNQRCTQVCTRTWLQKEKKNVVCKQTDWLESVLCFGRVWKFPVLP